MAIDAIRFVVRLYEKKVVISRSVAADAPLTWRRRNWTNLGQTRHRWHSCRVSGRCKFPPPRLPNPIPLISPRCQPQSTPDTALSSLSLANRLRWKLITFVTDAAQHDWTLQPTSTSWTSSVRRDWQINSSLWRLFARKMLQIIWVDKKTKSPMVNFFTK